MLECVVNVSEGRDATVISRLTAAAGGALLDVHSDRHHHRSVFTLGGLDVEQVAYELAAEAVRSIDIRAHHGVHPRLGAVDVVPFAPLAGSTLADALAARDRLAAQMAGDLGVPCFLFGPERALPDVRRLAFDPLRPDFGPASLHLTAGAICVGARPVLVAYNLWLAEGDLAVARRLARSIRSAEVRALGLDAGQPQVSCNLLAPERVGPAAVYDAVGAEARIARAELVGLVPAAVLDAVPRSRWLALDLDEGRTIEARLKEAGLDGGSL